MFKTINNQGVIAKESYGSENTVSNRGGSRIFSRLGADFLEIRILNDLLVNR